MSARVQAGWTALAGAALVGAGWPLLVASEPAEPTPPPAVEQPAPPAGQVAVCPLVKDLPCLTQPAEQVNGDIPGRLAAEAIP